MSHKPPSVIVLAWLVLGAGCRSSVDPTPARPSGRERVDTRVVAPPQDAPSAPLPDAAADVVDEALAALAANPASSWTDPRMLAALAVSCDANNPQPDDPFNNPLHCFFQFAEQSCSVDPCREGEHDPCEMDCGRRCESCSEDCRARCRRCRAGCDGGDCGPSCARSCASCMGACVRRRDRCATAVCAARYAACTREKAAEFRRSGCAEVCARCTAACIDDDDAMTCVERCVTRRGRCTPILRSTCVSQGPDYGAAYLDAGVDGSGGADVAMGLDAATDP